VEQYYLMWLEPIILNLDQKSIFQAPIKPQIALAKISMGQDGVKWDFLELGVVLHNFNTETMLTNEIITNQLKL